MQQTIHSEAPEGNDFDRSKFYIFLNEYTLDMHNIDIKLQSMMQMMNEFAQSFQQ